MAMTTAARLTAAFLCVVAAGCSGPKPEPPVEAPPPPVSQHVPIGQLPPIDINAVLAHTKVLSSDEFEGRAPGTVGEERTVAFLVDQFKKAGLKPGNTDGTYIQKVPLVGITPAPAPLVLTNGATTQTLKW
jgi:hypothetical protein